MTNKRTSVVTHTPEVSGRPSDRPGIFVAGAFTAALTTDRGFDHETGARLRFLLGVAKEHSGRVFSAHETESWGADLEQPAQLAQRDLDELCACTHFVLYYGAVESLGVLVEMGYAIGLGRPVLVIVDESLTGRSDFYRGLGEIGLLREIVWTDEESVRSELLKFFARR